MPRRPLAARCLQRGECGGHGDAGHERGRGCKHGELAPARGEEAHLRFQARAGRCGEGAGASAGRAGGEMGWGALCVPWAGMLVCTQWPHTHIHVCIRVCVLYNHACTRVRQHNACKRTCTPARLHTHVHKTITLTLTLTHRGVCWNKKNKRWQAAINSGGKYIYLGSFMNVSEHVCAASRTLLPFGGCCALLALCSDQHTGMRSECGPTPALHELHELHVPLPMANLAPPTCPCGPPACPPMSPQLPNPGPDVEIVGS